VPEDAAVEVVAGPAAGTRVGLGGALLIGRSAEDDGALGGDPELSREHARLRRLDDGRILVEDLGSTNGTYVNGDRIPGPTLVEPGDEVGVGSSVLRILAGPASPAGAPAAAPPAAPPPKERRPALRMVAGWAPGALIAIGKGPVTVGRAAAGASALGDDAAIGEEHVRVSPAPGGGVVLEDLGSGSGTLVNGQPIPAPTVVPVGERFEIGSAILEVVQTAGAVPEGAGDSALSLGGVREVPGGLFALIAARAPVRRDQVVRVFFVALASALAANFLIRTVAIQVANVPDDLTALKLQSLIGATLIPIAANSAGFYKAFGRPDDRSFKRYLAPTFGVPILFVIVNLLRMNHTGALDVLVTVTVTVVPIAICAPLMLMLRDRVARERIGAARGG